MSSISLIIFSLALVSLAYPSENLTLEFNPIHYYQQINVLELINEGVMEWKPNQTGECLHELITNAWIFEPLTNETGTRFSTISVRFDSNCYSSFVQTKNSMLMYPFGYPAVSPDFSGGFVDFPLFVQVITANHFDNDTHTYEKNYSSGEVLIGWSCCASFGINTKDEYVVVQKNFSKCTITVEAYGPTVIVSSLKLFYGTLLLILVPALITIIAHFVMLICQRNAVEKSEASFKRANCECRLFWLVWVLAFAVYIGLVMVPLY